MKTLANMMPRKMVTLYAVPCVDKDDITKENPQGLLGLNVFPTREEAETFARAVKNPNYVEYSEATLPWHEKAEVDEMEFAIPQNARDMARYNLHGWGWEDEADVLDWTDAERFGGVPSCK